MEQNGSFFLDSELQQNATAIYGTLSLPFAVCQTISAFGAIIGNGIIAMTFLWDKKLRNRQHYHLFSLAVADILSALFGTLVSIPNHIGYPEHNLLCLIGIASTTCFYLISVYNKVSVSLNRYWASVYYMSYYKHRELIYTKIMIALAWILGCTPGIAIMLGWHQEFKSNTCKYLDVVTDNFQITIFFILYVIPELLLIFFYSRIIYTIKKKVIANIFF